MDRTRLVFRMAPWMRRLSVLGGLILAFTICFSTTLVVVADETVRLPLSACDVSGALAFSWTETSLSETSPESIDPATFEAEVISLVNQERARYGLYPLVRNTSLTMAARGHSQDMSDRDFFSHVGSDGSGFVERIQRAGYTSICAAGENIAAGQISPQAVVSAWMSSAGHRANILSDKFRDIGVGYVYEADDTYPAGTYGYRHYWTQNFGSRDCWGPTPTLANVVPPTATSTRPPTATWTPTRTPTLIPTRTPTWTPFPTFTFTPTRTPTWTPMPSPTWTLTWTPRPTPTWTWTPSPTWTATATQEPQTIVSTSTPPPTDAAALVGVIELQGRHDKPGMSWVVPLDVTLLREDGTVVVDVPLYTTPLGEFVVTKLAPGTYDVRVKNPLTLANYKSTVTLVPGANRVDLGTLLAGDSSNDNVVDVLDFSLLRASFGTRAREADFNGDGVVDVFDFSLLRAHFGLSGDIPIN